MVAGEPYFVEASGEGEVEELLEVAAQHGEHSAVVLEPVEAHEGVARGVFEPHPAAMRCLRRPRRLVLPHKESGWFAALLPLRWPPRLPRQLFAHR